MGTEKRSGHNEFGSSTLNILSHSSLQYPTGRQNTLGDGLNLPVVVVGSSSSTVSSSSTSTSTYPSFAAFPIASPCGACKLLRRRCAKDCILAPHFPAAEPEKFACIHKVYGACNVIKMLQELPEDTRGDATSSLVYEANARLHDPVYSCVRIVVHLHHGVKDLQNQIITLEDELFQLNMQYRSMVTKMNLLTNSLQKQHFHPNLASSDSPSPTPLSTVGATPCYNTLTPQTQYTSTFSLFPSL